MTATANLHESLPDLLTIHDIAALLKVGRTTAYARTRDPDFPDPLAITGGLLSLVHPRGGALPRVAADPEEGLPAAGR